MKPHQWKYRIAIQQFEHGMPSHFRNVVILSKQPIGMIQKAIEAGFDTEREAFLKEGKKWCK